MHSYNRNPFEWETHGYTKTLHFNNKTTYLHIVISTKAGTEQNKGGEGRVNKCAHSRMQGRSSKTKPSRGSYCTFKCNQSKLILLLLLVILLFLFSKTFSTSPTN